MGAREDAILQVLREDLMPLEDIYACMVAKQGMEGIVPITDEFKRKVIGVWEVMQSSMNELFAVISKYRDYQLDKINLELGQFDIMFFILPGTDTALVAIVPALSNRGLLEVELENARRKILEILQTR